MVGFFKLADLVLMKNHLHLKNQLNQKIISRLLLAVNNHGCGFQV